jgi:hypothetical protein
MEILAKHMKTLPLEIITQEIIPFTYKTQPNELLYDIESFHETNEYLHSLYQNKYEDDYLAWLDNDVARFMNNNVPTMYGITDENIEKMKRLYSFHDKSNGYIIQYIQFEMHLNYSEKMSIHLSLACLRPLERIRLLSFIDLIWE